MENKTAAAILARYFRGALPDNNYREIIVAMHKYASLQCAEMKEELERLRDRKAVTYKQSDYKQLQEEVERLRGALPSDEELATEIIARYTRNGRGLDIAKKAFIDAVQWIRLRSALSGKESKTDK